MPRQAGITSTFHENNNVQAQEIFLFSDVCIKAVFCSYKLEKNPLNIVIYVQFYKGCVFSLNVYYLHHLKSK